MDLHASSRSMSVARLIWLAWREARPVVQLIFQLRFVSGVVLAGGHLADFARLTTTFAELCWLSATWAIYLVNGVSDVVEDCENDSGRPIARGALPGDAARIVCYVLVAFALVCGVLVSAQMLILVVLMLAVGWAYSMGPRPLKMTMPGFVASVTVLGLLTYLAGRCAVDGEWSTPLFLFGVAMSLWMGLVGWTKDLSDTEGDRVAGRRTLPIVFGEPRARLLMAVSAVVLGCMFLIAAAFAAPQVSAAAWVDCFGALVVAAVLLSPMSVGDRRVRRRPYRAFMITQYTTHSALLISNAVPCCQILSIC
jgi:4-hydroxybenzoate polyprenyltransferase